MGYLQEHGQGLPAMICSGLLVGSGWILFALSASNILPAGGFAAVLAALVLAEILARFLTIGLMHFDGVDGGQDLNGSDALGTLLLRWVILVTVLGALAAGKGLPLLEGRPVIGLYLSGASLLLALMHLATGLRRAMRRPAVLIQSSPMIFAAGLVWSLDHIAETTPELQLATLLLLWLLWVLILWGGLSSPFGEDRRSRRHHLRETLLSIGPALLASMDVLILFSLFSPRTVAGYLILRAGGLAVTRAMRPVEIGAQARLRAAAVNGNTPSFVVNAARLNLGLLLIGGGICVGILALFPMLTRLFPPPFAAEKAVLFWLLLGAVAPALFGAGPLFLTITGQRREWALMSLTGAFLMAGLAYGLRVQTPLALAQLYAALQLATFGAAAAVIGQRRGVWPGLTALLFRRIRLL